jgi:hypothetical protein
LTESLDTPTTLAPAAAMRFAASEKAIASRVQPGVLSRG